MGGLSSRSFYMCVGVGGFVLKRERENKVCGGFGCFKRNSP
jgi:hypothetical protein